MPDGYLVTPGDHALDPGDATATSLTTYTTAEVIGTGIWSFDFNIFGFSGTGTRKGAYERSTSGDVYFCPDTPVSVFLTVTSAEVFAAPDYTVPIFGTPADDNLGGSGRGEKTCGVEGDETLHDTLDFGSLPDRDSIGCSSIVGQAGTATLTDDTLETIICFSTGTAIQTPSGERRIETLSAGDLVCTLDNGPQQIRWIGQKTVRATGALAPIRFARGTLGNYRDLLVSPQHRMLCGGHKTRLHFGMSEVLAPARSLVDDFGVTIEYGGIVTYVHMLFDAHEIVIANGAPSESFYPGSFGLETLGDPARDEIFRVFPELRSHIGGYGPARRHCVEASEARALVTA
jgi:hypothetical protein